MFDEVGYDDEMFDIDSDYSLGFKFHDGIVGSKGESTFLIHINFCETWFRSVGNVDDFLCFS